MLLQNLYKKELIHPPKFLLTNTHYLTMMGSVAYGVSSDTSDVDVYGFGIPPKENIFTHLAGEIQGFGTPIERFEQWQEHHIKDIKKDGSPVTYDLQIYNIVKYFDLCMDNNPNMLDSLFTPINCVLHSSAIAELVRENRKLFLSKRCFARFKGYAYAQLHKMATKTPQEGSKRYLDIQKHKYDTKFAYHLIRLLNECEQILIEGDLDLQRSKEELKAIRRGEVTEEEVRSRFAAKELLLNKLYTESKLINRPDEAKIKELLLNCLESHFGSLAKAITVPNEAEQTLQAIAKLVSKYEKNSNGSFWNFLKWFKK